MTQRSAAGVEIQTNPNTNLHHAELSRVSLVLAYPEVILDPPVLGCLFWASAVAGPGFLQVLGLGLGPSAPKIQERPWPQGLKNQTRRPGLVLGTPQI